VPKSTIGGGSRFEPLQDFRIRRAVDQQHSGAHRREILDDLTDSTVGGDCILSRNRRVAVCRRKLGGITQTRKHAIARRAIGGEFGESRRGVLMFAGFRKRHRLLERRAGLRCLLDLPPLVTAPGADADDDSDTRRNGIMAVALPQLFKLFAAYFLVDFLEYVGHAVALKLRRRPDRSPEVAFRSAAKQHRLSRTAIGSIRLGFVMEALGAPSVMMWRQQGKMRREAAVCPGFIAL
jgi:hypothetical protein